MPLGLGGELGDHEGDGIVSSKNRALRNFHGVHAAWKKVATSRPKFYRYSESICENSDLLMTVKAGFEIEDCAEQNVARVFASLARLKPSRRAARPRPR